MTLTVERKTQKFLDALGGAGAKAGKDAAVKKTVNVTKDTVDAVRKSFRAPLIETLLDVVEKKSASNDNAANKTETSKTPNCNEEN